jgi:hypothetical protein
MTAQLDANPSNLTVSGGLAPPPPIFCFAELIISSEVNQSWSRWRPYRVPGPPETDSFALLF